MAGYPTLDNLKEAVRNAGLDPSKIIGDPAAAAAQEFESLVGWDPFLSLGAETTKNLTPDDFDKPLDLRGGYISITSVEVGISYDDTSAKVAGTTLVANRDYVLGPDADTLVFTGSIRGGSNSIEVVGVPGYVTDVPDDAFQAVLQRAMITAWPYVQEGDGPLTKQTQGPVTFEFAGDTQYNRLKLMADYYLGVAAGYKRMTL